MRICCCGNEIPNNLTRCENPLKHKGFSEGAGGFSGCTHEDGYGYCDHPLVGEVMCCEYMHPTIFEAVICERAL